MEIKHPPENGNCSCKDCYKPMPKLDELDKTKIAIFYEDFRKQLPQTLVKPARFKRAEVKDGKYTEGSLEEGYVLAEDDLYQAFVGAFLAIRLEEREGIKKVVEKMKKKHFEFECSDCRKSRHYESFCECSDCPGAAKENNYNKALSDLLNELNKN